MCRACAEYQPCHGGVQLNGTEEVSLTIQAVVSTGSNNSLSSCYTPFHNIVVHLRGLSTTLVQNEMVRCEVDKTSCVFLHSLHKSKVIDRPAGDRVTPRLYPWNLYL